MKTTNIGFLILFITLVSCDDSDNNIDTGANTIPTVPFVTGTADFSSYVAVGASFTAGYTDGAIFIAAQENSFPNILSQKFGSESFTQPLMNDNIGGLLFEGQENPSFLPRLYFDGTGPVRLVGTPTTEVFTPPSSSYNNMGVSGAKCYHLLFDGYGNSENLSLGTANPYFVRMASTANATILGDAIAQAPTFFTLSEIGGNDVLGYATTGGDGTDPITPSEGAAGIGFDQTFDYLINTLTSGGAKGVVANVPYISSLPHFTTVLFNAIPLDAATAAALNLAYQTYNEGIQGALTNQLITSEEATSRTINFVEGQNAIVIIDKSLTDLSGFELPSYRHGTPEDLFLLATSSLLGEIDIENVTVLMSQGFTEEEAEQKSIIGLTFPLVDKWVLIPTEQEAIKTATDAYNIKISAIATAKGLGLVDLNAILQEASTTGIEFDDYNMTTNLVFGGLVSLDGIHLTARGYALMANKFLEAIDATYGSNFKASGNLTKAEDYITNYSPTLQ